MIQLEKFVVGGWWGDWHQLPISSSLGLDKKSSEKKVKDHYREIKKTIEEGIEEGYFSKEFGSKLLPEKPKASKPLSLTKITEEIW